MEVATNEYLRVYPTNSLLNIHQIKIPYQRMFPSNLYVLELLQQRFNRELYRSSPRSANLPRIPYELHLVSNLLALNPSVYMLAHCNNLLQRNTSSAIVSLCQETQRTLFRTATCGLASFNKTGGRYVLSKV